MPKIDAAPDPEHTIEVKSQQSNASNAAEAPSLASCSGNVQVKIGSCYSRHHYYCARYLLMLCAHSILPENL